MNIFRYNNSDYWWYVEVIDESPKRSKTIIRFIETWIAGCLFKEDELPKGYRLGIYIPKKSWIDTKWFIDNKLQEFIR